MAIFHFAAQVISRSDGGNAVAAAAYRAGMRFSCARTGLVFNSTRKREVAYRAILAPQGAAAWVFDRHSCGTRSKPQRQGPTVSWPARSRLHSPSNLPMRSTLRSFTGT